MIFEADQETIEALPVGKDFPVSGKWYSVTKHGSSHISMIKRRKKTVIVVTRDIHCRAIKAPKDAST